MDVQEQRDYIAKQTEVYLDLLPQLEVEAKGQWCVIHDEELIGTYDTFEDAVTAAASRFGRGPYLIKEIGAPREVPLPASLLVG